MLFFIKPIFGKEINKEFQTSDGFTFSLIGNWIEIPRDILDAYAQAISEQTNMQKQHWNYAYQLASSEKWFQYPYILVQVIEKGRIPESELKNYKKVESEMNRGIQETREKATGLFTDFNIGETYFDSDSHILFTAMKMNVQGIGDVIGLTAVKLTEKGYIQISGYSLASAADHYLPIYKDMAKQVKLEAHLVYTPRLTDSIPIISGINWGRVGEKALIGTIIGGILGAIGLLFKKLKKS